MEIAASEELVDLAAEGFDAGIRLGQFIDADMVAVRLTPPFPLRRRRQPRISAPARTARTHRRSASACLLAHCAARTARSRPGPLSTATSRSRSIVSGPLIAHDFPTMLGAAVEDMGLAQVPEPIAARPGESGKTRARAGAVRADGAGRVSLLSQPPSNDAETASLHRSREEPLGRAA